MNIIADLFSAVGFIIGLLFRFLILMPIKLRRNCTFSAQSCHQVTDLTLMCCLFDQLMLANFSKHREQQYLLSSEKHISN